MLPEHTSVLETHAERIIPVNYKKYVPPKHPQTQPECVYWNKLGIKTCSLGTRPTHTRDWQLWFPIWTANTHAHEFNQDGRQKHPAMHERKTT